MTTVLLDDSNLVAIGNAIREKNGSTDTYKPREMSEAITALESKDPSCNGLHIPDEALVITGNCQYRFANGGWDWFLEEYGDKVTTENISNASYMFSGNEELESISFDFNFKTSSTYHICNRIFAECKNLKETGGAINNLKPGISGMEQFFFFCYKLRYLPQFNNLDMSYLRSSGNYGMASMFYGCYSLRSIPEDFLKELYNPKLTNYYSTVFNSGFYNCYALDEIRGLNPQTGTITGNMFSGTFKECARLKNIIFATQDDGTPYSVNWKSQTIDLSEGIGYNIRSMSYITGHNSGISDDKAVTDDASYQALKNDPDWFAQGSLYGLPYSRYNHDSAVNTINSLPDTSAYLASAGGTNTIKFKGAAGSNTDGGAINTLTEEEIAVATAKGWTVSLV